MEHETRKKAIVQSLAYIILLNMAIITTGIGLHELGHLAVGNSMGCGEGKIILADTASPGPYTELSCPQGVQEAALGLSGFPFIILFGLVFLLLKGFPERHFGFVVLGLSLMLASIDILLAVDSMLLSAVLSVGGLMLLSLGELRLLNAMPLKHPSLTSLSEI